mmetsp:Transcript_139462/g.446167  ORF Transcript_139462/g.446167 Transcript_139462/m.446167 type:complete len:219 (-) Transcript_139462:240-896(-)
MAQRLSSRRLQARLLLRMARRHCTRCRTSGCTKEISRERQASFHIVSPKHHASASATECLRDYQADDLRSVKTARARPPPTSTDRRSASKLLVQTAGTQSSLKPCSDKVTEWSSITLRKSGPSPESHKAATSTGRRPPPTHPTSPSRREWGTTSGGSAHRGTSFPYFALPPRPLTCCPRAAEANASRALKSEFRGHPAAPGARTGHRRGGPPAPSGRS